MLETHEGRETARGEVSGRERKTRQRARRLMGGNKKKTSDLGGIYEVWWQEQEEEEVHRRSRKVANRQTQREAERWQVWKEEGKVLKKRRGQAKILEIKESRGRQAGRR